MSRRDGRHTPPPYAEDGDDSRQARQRNFVTNSTHLRFYSRRGTNCSTLIIDGPSTGRTERAQ